jgi:hypothetical protein
MKRASERARHPVARRDTALGIWAPGMHVGRAGAGLRRCPLQRRNEPPAAARNTIGARPRHVG